MPPTIAGRHETDRADWYDARQDKYPPPEVAFQQRRQQIVGDCAQLKADVDSFEDSDVYGAFHRLLLDFSLTTRTNGRNQRSISQSRPHSSPRGSRAGGSMGYLRQDQHEGGPYSAKKR